MTLLKYPGQFLILILATPLMLLIAGAILWRQVFGKDAEDDRP